MNRHCGHILFMQSVSEALKVQQVRTAFQGIVSGYSLARIELDRYARMIRSIAAICPHV